MDKKIKTLENSSQLIEIDENFKLNAGPGSGKTTFLINHIKHIIDESDKLNYSRKIACITHTNIASDTIKERLENSINEVEVSTIHHFLYKHIVKPYLWTVATDFNLDDNSLSHIKKCFPSHSKLPQQFFWVWKDKGEEYIYSRLKKLNWVFDENKKLTINTLDSPNLPKEFLIEYKKNCWKDGSISPEDILFFSYNILNKNPKIANIIKIKFPYLFIDEFQDTNELQCEIINLIVESGIILGVVGDIAQSIYKFQGADVKSFINFKISNNFNEYNLKNNHRSNEYIVNILNKIRPDFKQKCCKPNKTTIKPTIIIGNFIDAYNEVKDLLQENFYSLTFKNENTNKLEYQTLKNNIKFNYLSEKQINNIFKKDSSYIRRNALRYSILAIESFRNKNIKESLHYMKNFCKKEDIDKYESIQNLFYLNYEYKNYKYKSITDFSNNYLKNKCKDIPTISRKGAKEEYDKYNYLDFALSLINNSNNQYFRTIHSCKGDEFNNVFLFLENEKKLNFLIEPNLKYNEEHRVYYVALSRAKEHIFINTPTLAASNITYLENMGFEILNLNK